MPSIPFFAALLSKQDMASWTKFIPRKPRIHKAFRAFKSSAKNIKHLQTAVTGNKKLRKVVSGLFSKKGVTLAASATVLDQDNQKNVCNGFDEDVEQTCCRMCDCQFTNCLPNQTMECRRPSVGEALSHFSQSLTSNVWSFLGALMPWIYWVGCVLTGLLALFLAWKPNLFKAFDFSVTLELVQNETVKKAAKTYIYRLLAEKEKFGYLYFLLNQRMAVPLDVQFNGELVIESENFDQVVETIEKMAQEFNCNTKIFEVTCVELLYFFTMLVNPYVKWIAVDYVLQCARTHAYLISAPDRMVKMPPTLENYW
ncbi:uncharacterized protein CEXT_420531 [Caerostris extrusa]|uniref:Uncharacterized protein n=1 Tax=Caerostris extrusa TaxID=172846 RepID=A0AAV4V3H2_CAEEX|nr:uncharacterized protein CEXT_420531 [Caerostris extrusa]